MTTPADGHPSGRVAVVTGGSRGAGRAVARDLARRGYAVVVAYGHDQRAAEAVVEAILAEQGSAIAVRADASDELDVERLFAETGWSFGGVDVVVHTAAAPAVPTSLTAVSVAEFDALCRVNTRAAWLVDREAARRLRDGGALVNLTTAATGAALRDYGLAAATQAAVAVLTQALALDLGDRDISVNALCVDAAAGWPPAVVADEVAFLLTRTGHAVTGQVIPLADPRRRRATRT